MKAWLTARRAAQRPIASLRVRDMDCPKYSAHGSVRRDQMGKFICASVVVSMWWKHRIANYYAIG